MTSTHQFIEDAIAGGWKPYNDIHNINDLEACYRFEILLDPLAWQAVGKTRGWDRLTDVAGDSNTPEYSNWFPYTWGWRQHRFIDHLADGKSIEEALTAISI